MMSTGDSNPHELGVNDTVVVHTRKGRQIALPRLRGLFSTTSPSSVARASTGPSRLEESLSTGVSPKQSKKAAKRLKIRVLTWNMHDSLPKGDLQELLGKVPSHNSSNSQPSILPNFPDGPDHLFHLIVIAGQECPTSSGIPMGLGAGFRLLDKDREKSDDSEKDADKARQHKFDRSKHSKSQEDLPPYEQPSGWTSMVEEWLCRGGGCSARNASSPTVSDVGHPKPLIRRLSSKHRRGPYQLLAKERLMGIYLAIYIHRDIKSLVRGTSKSAVTAGLIGGRVGNKGGVGISVNLDGTTLLFLNAHLAAHEGKVNHRLANLSKIKAELAVDDFLKNDDPRSKANDITDKFDYSFICGDLNFRLDISRLHADWLISREEFTQALAFDQLRKVMEEGTEFLGFHEAPINFPPTFKYDVTPHFKYTKGHTSTSMRLERAGDKSTILTDLEERALEELENGEVNETASMVSSTSTSVKSQVWDRESDGECVPSPSTPTMVTSGSKASVASAGTHKAKLKWFTLLSPSLSSPTAVFRPKYQHANTLPNDLGDLPSPRNYRKHNLQGKSGHDTRSPMILVDASKPNSNDDGTPILEERGVYDSCNKRRVPSWCDRILWKSTVVPDPLPEENVPGLSGRKRFSKFFANAFRTSSGRFVVEAPKDPLRDDEFKQEQSIFQPKTTLEKGARHLQRGKSAFAPPSTAPLQTEYPPRRSTTPFTSHLPPRDPLPRSPLSGDSSGQLSPSTAPSRWRFFPFLSPPPELDTATSYGSSHFTSPSKPRKGDVVCLSYNTLDDRAMRRLEGRSDHRPVIGTYEVYL